MQSDETDHKPMPSPADGHRRRHSEYAALTTAILLLACLAMLIL